MRTVFIVPSAHALQAYDSVFFSFNPVGPSVFHLQDGLVPGDCDATALLAESFRTGKPYSGGACSVTEPLTLRSPVLKDGAALHRLIASCPPLDVNSAYLYFLIGEHFSACSVVAEGPDALAGCVTAYRLPERPDTVFVWQVAVHESARGQGLGGRMLAEVCNKAAVSGPFRWIETTISPDNAASRRLFASLAEKKGVEMNETPFLEAADFNAAGDTAAHDPECLFRIGPFQPEP